MTIWMCLHWHREVVRYVNRVRIHLATGGTKEITGPLVCVISRAVGTVCDFRSRVWPAPRQVSLRVEMAV